jgi:hypothetical protein
VTIQGGVSGEIAFLKTTLAVVDPNRHRLAREPHSDDDVQILVPIDVAWREMQSEH